MRCRKWAVTGATCRLLPPFGPPQCRESSIMTPRRSPDPWFLAGAPSKLSVHPVDLDFQLFGRLKLYAVPQVHPPLFELGGARIASESASIVVGSRAKWPLAKCGAAALFCGVTVPPRLTPWAAHGRILASHEAKKSSRLSSFTGFRRLLPRSPDEHIWLQSKLRLKINHWRLSPGVHPREDEIENPSHPGVHPRYRNNDAYF